MRFLEAVQSCFKNYITFSGRASRSEYWYWQLFTLLGCLILQVVDDAILGVSFAGTADIFSIATLLPTIAVQVRRLHDIDRSGWWALIALTIIGFFIPLLIWAGKKVLKVRIASVPILCSGNYSQVLRS